MTFMLLVSGIDTYSQLNVELFLYSSDSKYISEENFPYYEINFLATYNGQPVELTKENIVINQDVYPSMPITVSSPDANNKQTASWIAAPIDVNSFKIFFTYNDEVYESATLITSMQELKILQIRDKEGLQQPLINYGNAGAGAELMQPLVVVNVKSKKHGDIEETISLDSITVDDPFSYIWYGSQSDMTLPPVEVEAATFYKLFLYFRPDNSDYLQQYLTAHYEGGMKESIRLIANFFTIASNTFLKLLDPNGGELLTPCWNYTITWEGNVKHLPTLLEYSTNNGASWNTIGETKNSYYSWKVPYAPSTRCLVKVIQEYAETSIQRLNKDQVSVWAISYNSDATRLISVNQNNIIREWDLTVSPPAMANEYHAISSGGSVSGGIEYFDNDSKFVILSNINNNSRLVFFNVGDDTPYLNKVIPDNFKPKEMKIDMNREYITLIPELGSRLMLISTEDGSFLKYINFPYPISDFDYSLKENKAVVAFMNNYVKIYSIPDFNELNSFEFNELKLIDRISISPNGNLIGMTSEDPAFTALKSNLTQMNIFDIASRQIVRTYEQAATNSVGVAFSPNSTSFLIATEGSPKISMWDLTDGKMYNDESGQGGVLTDFAMGPDGHSIATSAEGNDNLRIKFFSYPEHDSSDAVFEIGNPVIDANLMGFEDEYLATATSKIFTTHIYNDGNVPLILDENDFFRGKHFRFVKDFTPDTIYPEQYKDVEIVFNPLDTGNITDSVVISTCIGAIFCPVEAYSIPRTLSFYDDNFDFGESCVSEPVDKEIVLFRNEDPVPVTINYLSLEGDLPQSFEILSNIKDTVLKAGESLTVNIRFKPVEMQYNSCEIVVHHSGLEKFSVRTMLSGEGIGTFLNLSHTDLRFIPEIPVRTITVQNTSKNTIQVTGYATQPEGYFTILTSLPMTLEPDETGTLEVQWNGVMCEDVVLKLDAAPCAKAVDIICGMYSAETVVRIENTEADPKGEALVPVFFDIYEQKPYNGPRFMEAEFEIDYKIFFPESAKSDYGTATITRNEVSGDKRIVGVRVEGTFPNNGIIAYVKGVAGLSDTDTSIMKPVEDALYMGEFVTINKENGIFRLVNLCGSRRILHNSAAVKIQSINPNPVSENFSLEFDSREPGSCMIEIFNSSGAKVYGLDNQQVVKGNNIKKINVSGLQSGEYRVVVSKEDDKAVEPLIIVRLMNLYE